MFDMNVFYNSNAYLTKRNNIENDKAFKNRLLKIRKRENKFFNEKYLPFSLPKSKSFRNFTKNNLINISHFNLQPHFLGLYFLLYILQLWSLE